MRAWIVKDLTLGVLYVIRQSGCSIEPTLFGSRGLGAGGDCWLDTSKSCRKTGDVSLRILCDGSENGEIHRVGHHSLGSCLKIVSSFSKRVTQRMVVVFAPNAVLRCRLLPSLYSEKTMTRSCLCEIGNIINPKEARAFLFIFLWRNFENV